MEQAQPDFPEPSAELMIIGAGLVELELALRELGLRKPLFTERVLKRLKSSPMRRTVVRLRGPRHSAETVLALEQAEAWLAHATVIARTVRRG